MWNSSAVLMMVLLVVQATVQRWAGRWPAPCWSGDGGPGMTVQRSGLNAARISVENSSGCSQAAKWPPLSTSWK